MSVIIRKMTDDEFEAFYQCSVENHVKELLEKNHVSQEEAISETKKEVEEMLSTGVDK